MSMSKRSRVTLFVALAVGLAVSPALAQLSVPMPRMFVASSGAVASAQTTLTGIEGAATSVGKQLAAARAAKDVVKSLCLNDKLSQINAARSAANQKKSAIVQEAGAGNDTTQDSLVLSTLGDRVKQLVTEANQCIGAEGSTSEGSTVTQTVDQGQPADSPPAWFPVILPGDLPSAGGIGVAPPNSFPTAGVAPPECVSPDK
jgi:hypothetical protein